MNERQDRFGEPQDDQPAKSHQDASPSQKPQPELGPAKPLSYEEALALLNKKHEFPKGTKELIGGKNLERIRGLTHNKPLMEIEALCMCGLMTIEEFNQYIVLIDEIRKLRGTVIKTAEAIAVYVFDNHQEKLEIAGTKEEKPADRDEDDWFSNSQTPQEKPAQQIGKILDKFLQKIGVRPILPPQEREKNTPLYRLMDTMDEVIETISSQQFLERASFRNTLLQDLMDGFYSMLIMMVAQRLYCKHHRQKYSDEHRESFEKTLQEMNETWGRVFHRSFPGALSRSIESVTVKTIYGDSQSREKFFTTLYGVENLNEIPKSSNRKEVETLKAETEELFRRINELSCLRKVDPAARKFGKIEIQIYEEEEEANGTLLPMARALKLCRGRIIIDPSAAIKKPRIGERGVIYQVSKGVVEIEIDRGTGEINIKHTTFPLSIILKEYPYLKLKKFLYQFVLDNLENKQAHIPDLLIAQRGAATEPTVEEIALETASEIGKHRVVKHKKITRTNGTTQADTQTETQAEPQEQSVDTTYLQQLRGLQGNRVYRTAETLLGKPLRISGSHHVFKSRNEGTCVIALHGSDQVGIGMLKTFLDRAGIPPQEFKDAL